MSTDGLRYRPKAPTREPEVWTPDLLERVEWRRRAADEPFRGVAAPAGIRPGLFPLRSTGVDVSGVRRAGEDYLAALTPGQLAGGRLPMDDVSWRHWANGARYFLRHGLCLEELGEEPRRLALEVVRAALSDAGFAQVLDLMHLNLTIGELRGEEDLLNEWLYWFTVYGEPDRGGQPWGWQLDGHHVNVNCAFVGDQMVLTPTFLGAEPVHATSGKYAGTHVFRHEEALGQRLFDSLTGQQRARAVIGEVLPPDLFVGAFRDNHELDYQGLLLSDLDARQAEAAAELVGLYVGRAGDGHARVRTEEVLAHREETWFSWIGDGGPDSAFYYRVHSPVILIEFEHQAGVMFDNDVPTRRHIHTVVRTPNGNDYGADLLRLHHERHHRRGREGRNGTGADQT
ncbi:Protein of unknown function [Actinacidiphila yanglinensis]|uniref:DUF3500 domain-containing protein n=1 Tax=Actinacidiphila yanglinensis TaxID=310779 RepID=A0A1H6EGL3_9ACTN|nr:DUF3500 domain-containing protein [Actinacidiphila yanglinensis]SEG96079.1 Protein of unknown function [Actinacidiphila yanglinensis]